MKNVSFRIYTAILVLWIILAFFGAIYNLSKVPAEIQKWIPLSDSQKRQEIFGDIYNFILFINAHTGKNSHIRIFSKDTRTGLVMTYYGYPRIITLNHDEKEFLEIVKTKKYEYLASYNKEFIFDNYEKIASYSSKMSSDLGFIYKRK